MKITDFLSKNLVLPELQGREKGAVLRELASCIAQEQRLPVEDVLRVMEHRERLGSTAIGDGVAIPHGTLSGLKHLVLMFARSRDGVDFDAIDGRPSHLFFVLLTPDNNSGLMALAKVSRLMRKPDIRKALLEAPDAEALFQVIQAEEERL
jgi:PTS system nitrogen regulatory IIA component